MSTRWVLPLLPLVLALVARADTQVDKVQPVPPPGIKVADDDRKALQEGVDALGKQIESVRASQQGKPDLLGAAAGRADLSQRRSAVCLTMTSSTT